MATKVNPSMSDLPLRDYLVMELLLHKIKSGEVVSDMDVKNAMWSLSVQANQIIEERYQYIIAELDGKIRQADIDAENQRIERENAKILASFTPEKVRELQADFAERKEDEKRGWFSR